MKVTVAPHAGFCFGVQNAVQLAEQTAQNRTNVYTYGDIIHNEDVTARLERMGVRRIDDLNAADDSSTVIIRSHGAPKETYDFLLSKNVNVIDATCPFVTRIHGIVRRAAENGVPVIIIGEENHPEVIGTKGWAGECYVVLNGEIPSLSSAVVVSQTTMDFQTFDRVSKQILEKIPNAVIENTICETTRLRQNEAVELAKNSDAVVVIGGKESANTKKLYELCAKYCLRTYIIQNIDELMLENFQQTDIISIIAGASTPDWIIREVFLRMSENEKVLDAAVDVEVSDVVSNVEVNDVAEGAAEVEQLNTGDTAVESDNADFMQQVEGSIVRLRRGQFVKGKVVQLTDEEAYVNVGYKSDGILTKAEFSVAGDISPKSVLNIGDEIEVEILTLNDGQGNVQLSKKRIEAKEQWGSFVENIETDPGKEYVCKVYKVIKGGLLGKINGYNTFIPASHTSLKFKDNLDEFLGKELPVTILEVDKKQKRIVASHKSVLIKEENKKLDEVWGSFKKGDKVEGTVKRVTDFGAFVDIGGVDALLHIRDISWNNIKSPSEVVNVGDTITALVLHTDVEKRRISIGLKQLAPKPWELVDEKYLIGSTVEAKVVRIVPFGAFVELEPGVDGLIHISQVTDRRLERVEDVLKVGDVVTAKIVEVDSKKKKISLSIRQIIMEQKAEKAVKEKEDRPERPRREREERVVIPTYQETTQTLGDFFPKMSDEDE